MSPPTWTTSRLKLHVKQYVPRVRPESPTAITFVLQHGMPPGAAKEVYESFIWVLVSHPRCPPVHAIWALNTTGFGQSFLQNRDEIGDEPHWFDSAEDVRHLINYFQEDMRPPLVGIGQSWGCVAMLMNAARHARLFQGIVLSEPMVENGWYHSNDPGRLRGELQQKAGRAAGLSQALRWSRRRSRRDAEEWHQNHKMYREYPGQVLDKILKYDLRELEDGTVELVTPTAQVFPIFARPSPPLEGFPEGEDYRSRVLPNSEHEEGLYNAMGERVKEGMPGIHCKTWYMWATENSFISDEAYRERLVSISGTGLGDGGGKAKGQVEAVFIDGGHSLPLVEPTKTAGAIVHWLARSFWPWWLKEEAAREIEAPIDPTRLPHGLLERLDVLKKQAERKRPKL